MQVYIVTSGQTTLLHTPKQLTFEGAHYLTIRPINFMDYAEEENLTKIALAAKKLLLRPSTVNMVCSFWSRLSLLFASSSGYDKA